MTTTQVSTTNHELQPGESLLQGFAAHKKGFLWMSLFNDLLEDINQRRVLPEDNPDSPLSGINAAREMHVIGESYSAGLRSGASRAVPWLGGASLLALGIAIALQFDVGEQSDIRPTPAVPAVSARPPFTASLPDVPAASAQSIPDPILNFAPANAFQERPTLAAAAPNAAIAGVVAELTDIAVERDDGYTRVRFLLSDERDYWIQGEPQDGEIEVVISGTRLARAFSPRSFEGTGLNLRETHNTSIGLHLLLGFDDDSRIQSQLINDESGSQLVLDLLPSGNAAQQGYRAPLAAASGNVEAQRSKKVEQAASWGRIDQTEAAGAVETPEAYLALDHARALAAAQRNPEAIAEYIRALALDPDLHRAREDLVALLVESGRPEAAEQHLAEGIARTPGHSEYTLQRAQVLVALDQPQRAIAILESLPTPEHRRGDALNLLAALYQRKGDHPRAEKLFREAVRLAPHEGRLWMGLGISLEGQSRKGEALAVYEQAESFSNFGVGPRNWVRRRIRELSTVE